MNLTELIKNLTWADLVNKLKDILNLIPKSGEDIVNKIDEELGSEDWKTGGDGTSYTFGYGLTEDEGEVFWGQEIVPGVNQLTIADETGLTIGNAPFFGLSVASSGGVGNTEIRGWQASVIGSTIAKINSNTEIEIASGGSINISTNENINIQGLPTSSVGLSSGDLWVDTDTIKIVP